MQANVDLYQYLIKQKSRPRKEFQTFLFTACNLECGFCFFTDEQHKDFSGIESIILKGFQVASELRKLEEFESTSKQYQISILGGELFQDNIADKYIEDYKQYCRIIRENTLDLGLDLKFVFVSNLVYKNAKRVIKFITDLQSEGFNITLGTSYDLVGRFNPINKEIFKHNLFNEFPKEILHSVSILLTKPAIKKVIKNEDPNLDLFYEKGYLLIFEYYFSSEINKSKVYCPTDLDLYNALIYIADRYPKASPIDDMLNKEINYMSCGRSITIKAQSSNCENCRSLICQKSGFKHEHSGTLNGNNDIEESFLKKYNCFSCKYFRRCPLSCFQAFDHKDVATLDYCIYKKFFDETL